jgi:hypothetical protein
LALALELLVLGKYCIWADAQLLQFFWHGTHKFTKPVRARLWLVTGVDFLGKEDWAEDLCLTTSEIEIAFLILM